MSSHEVERSDDRCEVLLTTAACAVARLDGELRILDFNRQAEVMLGLRRDDVIGHNFADVAHLASHAGALLADLHHALAGQALSWTECNFVAADGCERVLLWKAHPVRSHEEIVGLMLVAQDLTERRLAERQVRTLAAEAERKNRLAEIGAVVARVIHDLNNPLTAATLISATLQEAAEREPATTLGDFRQELADLDTSLVDLRDLIDGCRNLTRDQKLELAELSVSELLHELMRTWSYEAAHRGIQLRTSVSPALPRVIADVGKLRRVLDNVIRNALEAIDHGPGCVTINVCAHGTSGLALTVQDSGPGLPEGIDVFEAFATTKTQGTGLGLAIARQFVEAHGGKIHAEPAHPHGTSFRILLPSLPAGHVERLLAAPPMSA
jgi:PAS domain S-box-containing protein